MRMSAGASEAVAVFKANAEIDIRHLLPSIRVPALILHAVQDRAIPVSMGRYMAQHLPNARLVELNSVDHLPFFDKPDDVVGHIRGVLTGASTAVDVDTSISTLMFTDIVGSTEMAVKKGDQRYADLLEAHHKMVRRELSLYRGQEIETTGDGFVLAFDGPTRAIKCGVAITKSLREIGVSTRVGLHTGECEIRDGRLRGVALNVAARVMALAPSGGVLVSETVRDLVAGSGLKFIDAGQHKLKGLPNRWRLFEVDPAA